MHVSNICLCLCTYVSRLASLAVLFFTFVTLSLPACLPACLPQVMVPVAKELKLPLALKLGAMRGMNPCLNPVSEGVQGARPAWRPVQGSRVE